MASIPFIDAHIHLWDLARLRYPWLAPPFDETGLMGSVERIATNFLPADYRSETEAAGWHVAGAVHVDAGAAPEDALAETEWLEGLAEREGLPDGIVAFAALEDPGVEDLLERHAAHPRVRGIRQIVNWHSNPYYSYTPRNLLAMPEWEHGFAMLARYRLSFDLQAYPGQIGTVARLGRRHPDVPIILNHAGMPLMQEPDGRALWQRNMRALAELPQASVKISGFGIIDHNWSVESIRPYVLDTIEIFGADRCMFASDLPTDRLYSSFGRIMNAYTTIVSALSDDERLDLFGRTANRVYRLGLDIGAAR